MKHIGNLSNSPVFYGLNSPNCMNFFDNKSFHVITHLQAKEDRDKPGLQAMLQKVLQLYASRVLSKRSYAKKGNFVAIFGLSLELRCLKNDMAFVVC